MGKRTHGPHLLNAIDANDHQKVHEILAIQIKNKTKIHEVLTSDVRRLASENSDCPVLVATSLSDPTIIKYLITKHSIDPNFVYKTGVGKKQKLLPLLVLAVKRGHYQTVEALLTLNANPNVVDKKGRGALYHAVRRANCRMTKMLLSKGANANLADNFNNTPLHTATRFGHVELVKLLLQYQGDAYKRDQSGAIPIHIAAKEGHIALIELFANRDVNVNTKVPCYSDSREVTPLHVAAEEGHKETVLALLEQFGAEVNMTDSEGETPLHCTVIKEYDNYGMKSKDDFVDTAKILIKYGADPNMKNGRGETPLHHAARNEFQKIVELLIAVGADATIEDNDNNKAGDLVSDEDTVSKLALKRAAENREKMLSNFMELRAKGMSGSISSMPFQGSMSNISISSPMGSLMRGRSMSNPQLLDDMDNRSLIYGEDGYMMPHRFAGGMGSMTSLNSAQIGMGMNINRLNMGMGNMGIGMNNMGMGMNNMGMNMAPGLMRQGSTSSFASAAPSQMSFSRGEDNTYARIDSDTGSVISDGSAMFAGPRWSGRPKKKSFEHQLRQRAMFQNDISSDSSVYDESVPFRRSRSMSTERGRILNNFPPGMHIPMQSSTPVKQYPVVAPKPRLHINQSQTSSSPQSPKSPTESQHSTLSFHSARHSAGSTSPKRSSSQTSNNSGKHSKGPTSKARETGDSSLWEVTPNTTVSTLTKLSDSRDGSVSSNNSDNQSTPRNEEPYHEDIEGEAVYANMPADYEQQQPVYDAVPSEHIQHQRNVPQVTIQIRPEQNVNVNARGINQAAIQMVQQQQHQSAMVNGSQGMISDSDDTFFDDESFDTLSDFNVLESPPNKVTEPVEISTKYIQRPTEPPPPSPTKTRSPEIKHDPKLQSWLAEQATIISDRQKANYEIINPVQADPEPVAHSTPPSSQVDDMIMSVSETHSDNEQDEKQNTVIPNQKAMAKEAMRIEAEKEAKKRERKGSKSKGDKSSKDGKSKDGKSKGKKKKKKTKSSPSRSESVGSPTSSLPSPPAAVHEVEPVPLIIPQTPPTKPKPPLKPKPAPRNGKSTSKSTKPHKPPKQMVPPAEVSTVQQQIQQQLQLKFKHRHDDTETEDDDTIIAEENVYVNYESVSSSAPHTPQSPDKFANNMQPPLGMDVSNDASMSWDETEAEHMLKLRMPSQDGAARQGENEYMEMKDVMQDPGEVFEPNPPSPQGPPNSGHVLAASYSSESKNTSPTQNIVVYMREKRKDPSPVGPRHSFTNSRYYPVPGAEELSDRLSGQHNIANKYNNNNNMAAINVDSPESIDKKEERRIMSESDLLDMDDSRADDIIQNHVLNIQKYQLQQKQVQHVPHVHMDPEGMPCPDPAAGHVPASPKHTSPTQLYAQVNKVHKQTRISDASTISGNHIQSSSPVDHSNSPVRLSPRPDMNQNTDFDPSQIPGIRENTYEELPSPKRRVTIGAEEIIPEPQKLPKNHDHRNISYNTNGKMRISLIGGNSDGIYVHRIDPGSDAELKGLREGDQVLKINGRSMKSKTKEEAILLLMAAQKSVDILVRYKKDRYDRIIQNGGMGDSFFVKALFNYTSTQRGEMKIYKNDVFSIRDTMPDGKMGSWTALKVNAKPNEVQHGMIPNLARAEQAALAEKRKEEVGLEKEQRGGFLRRSLRRAKSAERLDKENKAINKTMPPVIGEIKAYQRVEQKPVEFIRPIILLGLFCDTVRDRILKDSPGLFDQAPPEVEIPARDSREEGGAKIPVNVDMIQDIVDKNKHCLMIVSPKAINYLHTTHLFPIVIYLSPGSKTVIKSLREKLAPGFDKKSSFMYEEAMGFEKSHNHLFTATVTYTLDDSWFTLLKDTIGRIQNQPIWQPVSKVIEDNDDLDYPEMSPDVSPKRSSGSISISPPMMKPLSQSNSKNRSSPKSPIGGIPDPIKNLLHRHQSTGSNSDADMSQDMETIDVGIRRPRDIALTYDGYFLSDPSRAPNNLSTSVDEANIDILGYTNGSSGGGSDDMEIGGHKPRSILKKKRPSQSSQEGPLGTYRRQSGSEPDLNNHPMLNGEVPTFIRKYGGGGVKFNADVTFKEKQDLLRQKALEQQAMHDREAELQRELTDEENKRQQEIQEEEAALSDEQFRQRYAQQQQQLQQQQQQLAAQRAMQNQQANSMNVQQQLFMQHVVTQQQNQHQKRQQPRPAMIRRRPPPQTNPQVRQYQSTMPVINFQLDLDENWRNPIQSLLSDIMTEGEVSNAMKELETKDKMERKEYIDDIIAIWLSKYGNTLLVPSSGTMVVPSAQTIPLDSSEPTPELTGETSKSEAAILDEKWEMTF